MKALDERREKKFGTAAALLVGVISHRDVELTSNARMSKENENISLGQITFCFYGECNNDGSTSIYIFLALWILGQTYC